MITLLSKIATLVLLVLMLIATLSSGGKCLSEGWDVWLAAGLLAGFFVLFFAPAVDVALGTQRPQPASAPPA
jgi:hypothetical protein